MAGLLQEIWIQDIQEALYPPNSILLKSTDHSAFAHNNVVHVPNAGTNQNVSKNRSLAGGLPSPSLRTDNDKSYNVDSYSLDPLIISELETYQINYDKRKSVMYNSLKNLETVVTNNFLYQIAPTAAMSATSIIYTSGALQTSDLAFNSTGATATGSRSAVTMSDIFRLKTILDNQNVPNDGQRVLLCPDDMFNNELLAIPNILQSYQLGSIGLNESVVATGTLAKVAGFNILTRPTTVVYKMLTGGTVNALETVDASGNPTIAATDSKAILAWHPSTVSHCKGEIQVFYQEVVAQAYGSLLSFNVFEGASQLRYDGKGIAALVQVA